jgi:hypothetical protein
MTPDEFFTHNNGYDNRSFISPFLGQFISYQHGNCSVIMNQERADKNTVDHHVNIIRLRHKRRPSQV